MLWTLHKHGEWKMTEGSWFTLVLSVSTAAPPRMVSRSGIPVPGLLFTEKIRYPKVPKLRTKSY